MSSRAGKKPRFYGYPEAEEVAGAKYEVKHNENPILRGVTLVIGAWLVSKLNFLQAYLWHNAGFHGLRSLSPVFQYRERYYPTVIPVSDEPSFSPSMYTKPDSFKALAKGLPGRYHSIADYHALYLSGELTPLAVAESLLPLVARDVPSRSSHSVAFVESRVELILEAARASTQRYKEGKSLGILDGVPVGVKDECDVAGYRTCSGRKSDPTMFDVKDESDWPVQKWQEAGVIILGKMNMHEMGADTTNNNPNWGTPRNPHNSQYYTGGSSGGSAYAVSAGLLPIALGTDGGGSIRIPSSFCGVYGLKPSHQRIGDVPSTVTVIGPIAASISDLEVAYRVMAYPDPSHPVGSLFSPPRPQEGIRNKVIGIYEPWFERADPEVKARCHQVVQYYRESLGYEIVPIDIPYLPEGQTAHALTILAEMAIRVKNAVPSSRHWLKDVTAANKVLLTVGAQTPAGDFLLAQQLRQLLMSHLAFLYQRHPGLVIVTPTTPIAGWPIEQEGDLTYGMSDANMSLRNMEYIWLANFAGCPAISCPVGYVTPKKGTGDVPVGIMGMGEWGSEDMLIEWGRDAERWLHDEASGGRRRPAVWEDVVGNAQVAMKATD